MIRALLTIVMVVSFGSAFAADKKADGKKGATKEVKITGINVMDRTITAQESKTSESTYTVLKDARITVKGVAGRKLEDVRLDSQATLMLNKEGKVIGISVEGKPKAKKPKK